MFPPCLSAIITYFTNTLLSASTVLLFFTLNSSLYGTKFEKRKYSFSSLLFAVLFRFNWSFGIIHIQLEELPIALLVVWVWIYFLSFYLLGKKSLFFSVILKRIFWHLVEQSIQQSLPTHHLMTLLRCHSFIFQSSRFFRLSF